MYQYTPIPKINLILLLLLLLPINYLITIILISEICMYIVYNMLISYDYLYYTGWFTISLSMFLIVGIFKYIFFTLESLRSFLYYLWSFIWWYKLQFFKLEFRFFTLLTNWLVEHFIEYVYLTNSVSIKKSSFPLIIMFTLRIVESTIYN